jgi:hypothetical protein
MSNLTEQEKLDLATHAQDAERLRTDPAFQRAILAMRKEVMEALLALDEGSETYLADNRRLRAEVKAIDSLCGQIANAIQRGTQIIRKPAAVA